MVTEPELLILDEPTAQLDPITASELINTVKKINRDLSLTVIIAEHRLEEVIPICDKLLVIENGTVLAFGKPEDVLKQLYGYSDIMCGMPAAARISALLGENECALSVTQGRELVRKDGNERNCRKTDLMITAEKTPLSRSVTFISVTNERLRIFSRDQVSRSMKTRYSASSAATAPDKQRRFHALPVFSVRIPETFMFSEKRSGITRTSRFTTSVLRSFRRT